MKMNETPSANRVHIAFLGRRNTGKSSLVNAVTGQNLSIVSEVMGTTTDPVYKAMEMLPLGPVVIIDTPGFDDEGELGELRVRRTKQVLNKSDAAVLVLDAGFLPGGELLLPEEKELVKIFKERKIPFIIVRNKRDLFEPTLSLTTQGPDTGQLSGEGSPPDTAADNAFYEGTEILPVSAKTGFNINLLKEKIASAALPHEPERKLVADLIKPLDLVVLVIPIDKAAPKGRLILPQQQAIRDILEAGAAALTVRESELEQTLTRLEKKPALVITDSQAFALVSKVVPQNIPLTSFSILFARYKGFLKTSLAGAAALDSIKDGDKILICEGCTHHRQCDDIGTVKLPRWIKDYSRKEPQFSFCSGGDFPEDLSHYKLILHCGACMLNEREMQYRRKHSEAQNIPFSNYGIIIAHIQGILKRSIAMLDV